MILLISKKMGQSRLLRKSGRRNVAPNPYLIMATVIVNNDANVQAANGSNNMSLRNAMAITNIVTAYPDKMPDDFKLVFHNDLRYMKRDKSFSKDCYCGLVPFFNGKEHLEFAMLQWDLLTDDIATFNAKGEFVAFVTPNDELHTFSRSTASADTTVKDWMEGVTNHFNNVADYKFTKLDYMCKYEERLYTKSLLGIVKKQALKEGFPLGFPSFFIIILLTL